MVDNPRFLILPWIDDPQPRLAHPRPSSAGACLWDWTERYNTTPVLIETFVETPRFTGAVYRASGWTHVGTTQGRGRYDTHMKRAQPKKDIWLRPLRDGIGSELSIVEISTHHPINRSDYERCNPSVVG